MSMTLLFLLLGGATVLLWSNRPRAGSILMSLTLAITYLIGSGVPARLLLQRLQVAEPSVSIAWQRRNAIVLLGWEIVTWPLGEITTGLLGAARVHEAARRYFECVAKAKVCRVVVSGGDPTHQGRPEADAMAESLRQVGVPARDLILEPRSNNTFKNAEYSSALIKAEGFDQVVLVTSGFHLTRSRLYFDHFVRLPIVSAPADHLNVAISALPKSPHFTLFDLACTEVAGLVRYRVYNALGWNPPAAP